MSIRESISMPAARVAIGLTQGILLYLLYRAADRAIWPATDGLIFVPLVLVVAFVPILGLQGWGNMRPRTLILWTAAATVLLAGLGVHDVVRDPSGEAWRFVLEDRAEPILFPTTPLFFLAVLALFIAHSLIAAGDAERKYIAPYASYFDVGWKHAVQLALSIAFVAAFWGVVLLGAGLFALIEIDVFRELTERDWFRIPATAVAFACAVHATDVRVGLVRGIRTLGLTLLSWLLPLMALIAAGFLASLPFSGLEPLWNTRHGTLILLAVQAALILLINAAYQDGEGDHAPPALLRYAGSLAAAILVPLAAITAYGLSLRVGQYGWTSDRIFAAAGIVVAACYAVGYAWALAQPSAWLKRLEPTNIAAAFVILGVLFALFTPIADPARLSVASQVARLKSGQVSPQEFDFAYLRFDAGRYGRAALDELKTEVQGEHAAYIKEQAEAALRLQRREQARTPALTPDAVAANIAMHPREHALPTDFAGRNWAAVAKYLPGCLRAAAARCDGFFVDLDNDGADEILLADPAALSVFKRCAETWVHAGRMEGVCPDTLAALRTGQVKAVMPLWRDLDVNGRRLRIDTATAEDRAGCERR